MKVKEIELIKLNKNIDTDFIYDGITNYMKNSNFPKTLVIQNIDLSIDKVTNELKIYDETLKKGVKEVSDYRNQIQKYKENNISDIHELLSDLSL